MKTYVETIEKVANDIFNSYIGSGNDSIVNADIIAYIFDEDVRMVYYEINTEYEIKKNDYYDNMDEK